MKGFMITSPIPSFPMDWNVEAGQRKSAKSMRVSLPEFRDAAPIKKETMQGITIPNVEATIPLFCRSMKEKAKLLSKHHRKKENPVTVMK